MKELTNALSNKVYYDEKTNTIIKKYSQDKFKTIYGNQELKILGKLKYNIKVINQNELKLEYFNHKKFDDKNISLSDLTGVINALNDLHSLDVKNIKESNFSQVYYEFLLKQNFFKKIYIEENEEEIAKDALKILLKKPQVILHNDVVEGNILKTTKKIKLIDFEYSGLGNPIFDLASFLTEREMTQTQIDMSINLFNEKIDKNELDIVCAFLQIFWSRWAYFKFNSTKKKIYKDIADWKLNKYKELIKKIS